MITIIISDMWLFFLALFSRIIFRSFALCFPLAGGAYFTRKNMPIFRLSIVLENKKKKHTYLHRGKHHQFSDETFDRSSMKNRLTRGKICDISNINMFIWKDFRPHHHSSPPPTPHPSSPF